MRRSIFVKDGIVNKFFGNIRIETCYFVTSHDGADYCRLDRIIELKRGHIIIMYKKMVAFGFLATSSCKLACVIE